MPRIIHVVQEPITFEWLREHFEHVEGEFSRIAFEALKYEDKTQPRHDRVAYGDIITLERFMTTQQVLDEHYHRDMRPALVPEHIGHMVEYGKDLLPAHLNAMGSVAVYRSPVTGEKRGYFIGGWRMGDLTALALNPTGGIVNPESKMSSKVQPTEDKKAIQLGWPPGAQFLGIYDGSPKRTVI